MIDKRSQIAIRAGLDVVLSKGVKKAIRLLILAQAIAFSPELFARSGSCGQIKFNCDKHYAQIGNYRSPLDCGVSTPRRKFGQIKSEGHAIGSRWRCLKGKPKIDIGLGAVIVHTPCGGRSPKGRNQRFAGSGCLNVNAEFFRRLRRCQGSQYAIEYSSKGREQGGRAYASKRTIKQQQYAEWGARTGT